MCQHPTRDTSIARAPARLAAGVERTTPINRRRLRGLPGVGAQADDREARPARRHPRTSPYRAGRSRRIKNCDPSGIRTFPGRFDANRGTTRTCIDCRGVPGRFGPVGSFRVPPSCSVAGTRIPWRRGNHVATGVTRDPRIASGRSGSDSSSSLTEREYLRRGRSHPSREEDELRHEPGSKDAHSVTWQACPRSGISATESSCWIDKLRLCST